MECRLEYHLFVGAALAVKNVCVFALQCCNPCFLLVDFSPRFGTEFYWHTYKLTVLLHAILE
jgi:hypothetical protein